MLPGAVAGRVTAAAAAVRGSLVGDEVSLRSRKEDGLAGGNRGSEGSRGEWATEQTDDLEKGIKQSEDEYCSRCSRAHL